MASLFSRIGKPAPNFTSAGNPAGQMRSQWGDMSAAQGKGQRMRTPNQGYQPPGLQQGGTPLARPPQSPPNPTAPPGGYAMPGRHPQRKPAGTGIVKRLFPAPQNPTRPFKRWNPNEFQAQW